MMSAKEDESMNYDIHSHMVISLPMYGDTHDQHEDTHMIVASLLCSDSCYIVN